jgi:hypothetical protein
MPYIYICAECLFVFGYSLPVLSSPTAPIPSRAVATPLVATSSIKLPWSDAQKQFISPQQRSSANFSFVEASKLAEDALRMPKSPSAYVDSFQTSLIAPPIPTMATPNATFRTAWNPSKISVSSPQTSHGYQVSPLSLLHRPGSTSSPFYSKDTSVASSNLGYIRWSGAGAGTGGGYANSVLRVRDAWLALQLSQQQIVSEEAVDALRLLLGKHLLSILQLFDEAIHELSTWLHRISASYPQQLPADEVKKLLGLLQQRGDGDDDKKRVKLGNGSSVGLEEVLAFCKQSLQIPAEVLHRYDAASSFFRLCSHMLQLKTGSGVVDADFTSGQQYREPGSTLLDPVQAVQGGAKAAGSFVQRLKDMMFPSMHDTVHAYKCSTQGG